MAENKALTVAASAVPAVVQTQLPAHLQKQRGQIKGTQLLGQYVVPPRLKIIQALAQPPYNQFAQGTTVCVQSSGLTLVADYMFDEKTHKPLDKGGFPFHFVPIFFYPEFTLQNPLAAKGTLPFIRERTTDPNSALANFARQRKEIPCVEFAGETCKYVEHLNFICMLLNHELFGTPVVMGFMRGEHKYGRAFADKINARRTDVFGCVFQASAAVHRNDKYEWMGFDVDNPSITDPNADGYMSPWVEDVAMYEEFGRMYESFEEIHRQGLLQANYDDDATDTVPGTVVPPSDATVGKGEY